MTGFALMRTTRKEEQNSKRLCAWASARGEGEAKRAPGNSVSFLENLKSAA